MSSRAYTLDEFRTTVALIKQLRSDHKFSISIDSVPYIEISFMTDPEALENALEISTLPLDRFEEIEHEIAQLIAINLTDSQELSKANLVEEMVNEGKQEKVQNELIVLEQKLATVRQEFVATLPGEGYLEDYSHSEYIEETHFEKRVKIKSKVGRSTQERKLEGQYSEFLDADSLSHEKLQRKRTRFFRRGEFKKEDRKEEQNMIRALTSSETKSSDETTLTLSKYRRAIQDIQKKSLITLVLLFSGFIMGISNIFAGMVLIFLGITNSLLSLYTLWQETGELSVSSKLITYGTLGSLCLTILSLIGAFVF
jgi:hypothetical protein